MALERLSKCSRSVVCRFLSGVPSGILQTDWRKRCIQAKRHLLTEDVIKLQEFQQRKLAAASFQSGSNGNFIEHFNKKMQRKDFILQDELKVLLHLCQTPDDMVVAKEAIYRYHSENPHSHGDFRFGPLFMRLCYEQGLEEMAAAAITDVTMKGFFNDCTSFNIAVDMLFLKNAYKNAMEVLRTMQMYSIPFNKDTLILAFGTCYKLNTPETYNICKTLIEENQINGVLLPRHAYLFAVALALRQNDAEMAECLFSKIIYTEERLYKNLQVVTLVKAGKLDEVTSILSAATLQKNPAFVKKLEFCQEVVDLVRGQCEDEPYKTKINELSSRLERTGQVIQLTLDDLLCHTPAGKPKSWPTMGDTRKTKSRQTLKTLNSALLSE